MAQGSDFAMDKINNSLAYLFHEENPWVQNASNAPNVSLGEHVTTRIKQFYLMNKFKKRVLRVSFLNYPGYLYVCMVLCALRDFLLSSFNNHLCLFQVVADNLPNEQIDCIKQVFQMMDTDKNGDLSFEELKNGLHKIGHPVPDPDVKMLLDAVSFLSFFFSVSSFWHEFAFRVFNG